MTTNAAIDDKPDRTHLLSTPDGTELCYVEWVPDTSGTSDIASRAARATILLVHGFGEHLGRYQRMAQQLARVGFHVGGCDLRGMGRSQGKRAFIHEYETYVADVEVAQAYLRRSVAPDVPAFIYGHSMGGLVVLRHAEQRRTQTVAGTIVSGPLLGVGFPVAPWTVVLGKLLARLAPQYHFPLKLRPELLTHDLEEQRAAATDPLMLDFTTPAWFMATNQAMEAAKQQLAQISWPTLWQIGSADQVCAPAASRAAFDRLKAFDTERRGSLADTAPHHEWREYPGLRHELHNEPAPDRDQVFADLLAWLNRRLP